MPLSGALTERLAEQLTRQLGTFVDIEQAVPVGGGSINDAYRVDSDHGIFFVKVNSADRHPSLFEAEADGLRRLHQAGALRAPQVIAFGEDHDDAYLLLEWIDEGVRDERYWSALGRGLAMLHARTAAEFGLERDNYIGTLKQPNDRRGTWHDFYVEQRLEPQLRLAVDRGRLGMGDRLRAERLFRALPGLYPHEPPALLHGDLWSGNVLCDQTGDPVLIDPAVYYGHREMDLAMTQLFGDTDHDFLSAYDEAFPLVQGWGDRLDLWQLYPLLVHLNLFGGTYREPVTRILNRYGAADRE